MPCEFTSASSFRCPAYANRTVSAAQPFDMIEFDHCVLLIHDAFLVAAAPLVPSIDDSDNGDGQGFTTVKVQISTFDPGQRLVGMLRASPPSAVDTPRGRREATGVRLPRPSSRSAAPRGDSRTSSARGSRDSVAGEGRKQLARCPVIAAGTSLNAKNVQKQPIIGGGIFGGIGQHAATKTLKFPAFSTRFRIRPGEP